MTLKALRTKHFGKYRVLLSTKAVQDIADIYDYIANHLLSS
ncbi:hypothetical protein [Gemella sp. ND 6198]|nr:hypothetical protein [Gemella sp. ND 6198]